jgi:hypothetical protein
MRKLNTPKWGKLYLQRNNRKYRRVANDRILEKGIKPETSIQSRKLKRDLKLGPRTRIFSKRRKNSGRNRKSQDIKGFNGKNQRDNREMKRKIGIYRNYKLSI